MESLDFLRTCLLAIATVFLVLGVLSLSIRILILFFPEKADEKDDSVVITAISQHYNKSYPHLRITKIEEEK